MLIMVDMRILITADLHYDIARSRPGADQLARQVRREGGDALVLVGDTVGRDPAPLRECLRLFSDFGGLRLFVPGNHCLWCREGENSLDRYNRLLAGWAAEEGFTLLDHQPHALGSTGLVGSVGWYDYSLAHAELGIPRAFYEAKIAPGAAEYYGRNPELLEAYRDELTDRHLAIAARWMDAVHVRLGMTDEAFVDLLADKLRRQLDDLHPRVERIVAFLHHLPFAELVPQDRPDRFAFAAAFMGSSRLGRVLLDCPRLTHVYCGHSHWPCRAQVEHLAVINIGSTYVDKRLEVLEV